MSYGRPPQTLTFSPTPPERGSFPIDHDGECKPVMEDYLKCLKKVGGANEHECRMIAKAYLQCRMERQLMAPDTMENLGFHEDRLAQLKAENERLKRERQEREAAAAAGGKQA